MIKPQFVQQVKDYIENISILLLNVQKEEIHSLINQVQSNEKLEDFCRDPKLEVIHITQEVVQEEDEDESKVYILRLELSVEYQERTRSISLIKTNPKKFLALLEEGTVISSLLHAVQMGGTNPYKLLFNYLSVAIEPFFLSFVKKKEEKSDNEKKKKAIPQITHYIDSLKVTLYQCQETFHIPSIDIEKYIHEDIKQIVEKNLARQSFKFSKKSIDEMENKISQLGTDIRKIVETFNEDPEIPNTISEINYWSSLDIALKNLKEKVNSTEIKFTLMSLRDHRKNKVTLVFEDYKNSLYTISQKASSYYRSFIKDLPIYEMKSCKNLKDLMTIIDKIFNQLKKIKTCDYPVRRAFQLVKAISGDLIEQIIKILETYSLLDLNYAAFEKVTSSVADLFRQLTQNKETLRNILKSRMSKSTKYKFVDDTTLKLEGRISELRRFRREQNELQLVIQKVFTPDSLDMNDGVNPLEKVHKAYEKFISLGNKLLDITTEGEKLFNSAMKKYNIQIEEIEKIIIRTIRDRLGSAKNAAESFRVFSQFNALFYKEGIRNSVQAYQKQLISQVKADIEKLEEKFKRKYKKSEVVNLSEVRDIPSVAGHIIWARQIEKQLETYVKRIEAVVGKGWERLQLLRQDVSWVLNESLSDVMKIPLQRLQTAVRKIKVLKKAKPEIVGTAIVIAYLQIVFPEAKSEWEEMVEESKQQLEKDEKEENQVPGQALSAAETLLRDELNVAKRQQKELIEKCNLIKNKLRENVNTLIDIWNKDVINVLKSGNWRILKIGMNNEVAESVIISGDIFEITELKNKKLDLRVNFHNGVVDLLKEYRVLSLPWLKLRDRIEKVIMKTVVNALDIYPYYLSFNNAINAYKRTLAKINEEVFTLAAGNMKKVEEKLSKGFKLSWKKVHTLQKYSNNLSNEVHQFQMKSELMMKRYEKISTSLEKIKICKFKEMNDLIREIQQTVDAMNLEENDYSNLKIWVKELNEKVEEILKERLLKLIIDWKKHFLSLSITENEDMAEKEDNDYFNENPLTPYEMSIKISHKVMHSEPSVENVKIHWYTNLHKCFSVVCNLPRILSDRYDISQGNEIDSNKYSYLLSKIDGSLIREVYVMIDKKMDEVSAYVNKWLEYQALYSVDSFTISSHLGSNLKAWKQLLEGIKSAKKEAESSEAQQDFGAVVVNFREIQAKIHNKYDKTMKEILVRFRGKLGKKSREFYNQISNQRKMLEKCDLETKDGGIYFLQEQAKISKEINEWGSLMDILLNGQDMLERNKIKLKEGWVYAENVKSEWDSLLEIFKEKEESMKMVRPKLIANVHREFKEIKELTKKVKNEWTVKKPVGDQEPKMALTVLETFEMKIKTITEKDDKIQIANKILNLELEDISHETKPLREDIENLRTVWMNLEKYHAGIREIRESQLRAIVPKNIRIQLDGFIDEIKKTSTWMQSYEPVTKFKEAVVGYRRTLPILSELRSEAMQPKHWVELQKRLNVSWNLAELTVGDLWKTDINANEKIFQEILTVAKGELVLVVFLQETKDKWNKLTFELVNFNNRCWLIKGWDEFFEEINDSLKSLSSTRASPYFKTFREELVSWEKKLSAINFAADIWMDVQRIWVYLEGVFIGNNDIKAQLPQETQKFRIVDREFVNLMRRVHKNPIVTDVLDIPNIQKQLEKLQSMLQKIQKSLGEYLEKQRQAFPRFYFVGDEDLLEIIGHTQDPYKIQKHLKKMFAGISQLGIENPKEKEFLITSMISKEGETVTFKKKVKMTPDIKIYEWLTNVENEMRDTLSKVQIDAFNELYPLFKEANFKDKKFTQWINKYPTQLIVTSSQICWTKITEENLSTESGKKKVLQLLLKMLSALAESVLKISDNILRTKTEHLITELVHKRDVVRKLIKDNVNNKDDFGWLVAMRLYCNKTAKDWKEVLIIKIANADFYYGFEYLGITDKLVQTPLTDRVYIALTQAMYSKQGGSPFGPAGTGKTETVKMLGNQLGRYCIVFNCDENFDFKAMGRIFVGLCECGAWGCFDEFNRLNEKILSAVSQQILTIQKALRDNQPKIELINRKVNVTITTGIFITMNPDYAGRSQLPQNLKRLFRSIAMVRPDQEIIAEVIMFSQGFVNSESLARKICVFFNLCHDELSKQSHYDFGLRALKSVLVNAGLLKRREINHSLEAEQRVLIQSVLETVTPKLVGDDNEILKSLLIELFPGANLEMRKLDSLKEKIIEIALSKNLLPDEKWVEKVIQLYQIQTISHGVILVGPAGCGKSTCWNVLIEAIEALEKEKGIEKKSISYVIDPKALSKEELYGNLDPTTREWTDGIFTHILRKIVDNLRGESEQKHFIVFDGDVDPEWVENLNSVLDCNKLFTLPNGERLGIPENVKIFFEVRNLDYATLATVSRCGMVWYGKDIVSMQMTLQNFIKKLQHVPVEKGTTLEADYLKIQNRAVKVLSNYFKEGGIFERAVEHAEKEEHVMKYGYPKSLSSAFNLLCKGIMDLVEFEFSKNQQIDDEILEKFITKRLIWALFWGIGCSMLRESRINFSSYIKKETIIPCPSGDLVDFVPNIENGEWQNWSDRVPIVDVDPKSIITGAVIPTSDTARHTELLLSWIKNERCVILCGPPGSGKTMILTEVLKHLHNFIAVPLNFSSQTDPGLILKTFDQHCRIFSSPEGAVLRPVQDDKSLVMFCDEINLPSNDKYGTQRVITFIRQLVEQRGFWRASDKQWVKVEKIFFVGACNPPTDPGRVVMTPRFLRHTGVLYVDFPGYDSLMQIYGTFSNALFKLDQISRMSDKLKDNAVKAMVNFYSASQKRFTTELQPHYIYSPRELTRWLRALHEGIIMGESLPSDQDFIKLLVHEGLRIFSDRLVLDSEKMWTQNKLDETIRNHFSRVDDETLEHPILYTFMFEADSYVSMKRDKLGEFIQDKMNTFAEDQLDNRLVLFDSVLEHVLRIDRVLRQPLGHLLLAGVSGAGKTILPRFVSYVIGYDVYQVKTHSKYSLQDFEEDLRKIMKEAGVNQKKICFIFDESNVLEPAFLEYMNALLASGEVPGLFEDDELSQLLTQCKTLVHSSQIETDEEVYQWFIEQVQKNLHIVFTINPVGVDFKNRQCTSPALFNRCVVDWFGDWSENGLIAVGSAFTEELKLDTMNVNDTSEEAEIERHKLIVDCCVKFHDCVRDFSEKLSKTGKRNFVTPRDYLDLLYHFNSLYKSKVKELKDQQNHLDGGIGKLVDTEKEVAKLKSELEDKKKILDEKNALAQKKLKKMVKEQQRAEKRKNESEEFAVELTKQEKKIKKKKAKAEEDLSLVEPMLEEARNAVANIKKKFLVEIAALPNPPNIIRKVLEAVVIMIDAKSKGRIEWQSIRHRLRKPTFKKDVIEFDSRTITDPVRKKIKKMMTNISFEAADRASKAAGPLAKWLDSQLQYGEILLKVEPLENEVKEIKVKYDSLKQKQDETKNEIKDLEKRIAIYEEDYAKLISESQLIKAEMEKVKKKVDRSTDLLSSLASESQRWSIQSKEFFKEIECIAGHVLLSSAFLTYSGNFDEHMRRIVFKEWNQILNSIGIKIKPDFNVIGYLSDAQTRLNWQANKLPVDDLYVENAIMLDKYHRYPLIIDPTGSAVEFICATYKKEKIVRTSFLDSGFLKNLETSMRFGTPLLVEDAEKLDPILNPVLNREIIRHGGRNLVRLASQDIDFSDNFKLFMSTRDPTFNFAVDLMSRSTMVNFTVTPASLQSQCLNIVLKSERPDIEKQRKEQLKLQGEYALQLRKLEDELLMAISKAKGNLLENEALINTLENLKKSARVISEKVEQAEENMKKFEMVRSKYNQFASYCSKIYFSFEKLQEIHFLYHFSLDYFLSLLNHLLKEKGNSAEKLTNRFFGLVYERTAKSLLYKDRLTFALKLCEIKIQGTKDQIPREEYNFLLKSGKLFPRLIKVTKSLGLTKTQLQLLTEISHLPAFRGIEKHINGNLEKWELVLKSNDVRIPVCWDVSKSEIVEEFRNLLIMKALRPEFFSYQAEKFVCKVFGKQFLSIDVDLEKVVYKDVGHDTPLLLISLPGFDASNEVTELSWKKKVDCKAIAMGSSEGYEEADIELPKAMKYGSWLLLKNVHLSPSYLIKVEKMLHKKKLEKKIHESFRLFLTAEVHKSIPVNLLRGSYKIVYEPAPGIKANISQSFNSLDKKLVDREPVERGKLYLFAAWFHAIVQERLRFVPVGWSKYYEFTQGDLKWSFDAIDKWVDIVSKGRSNIQPSKLPWKAIHTLIGESIYGGKIDNDFDKEILDNFYKKFFSEKIYEIGFNLHEAKEHSIKAPSGMKFDDFSKFIDTLESGEQPEWMELPPTVRLMTLTKQTQNTLRNLNKVQETRGEFIGVGGDESSLSEVGNLWKDVKETVESWVAVLPREIPFFKIQNSKSDNHIHRCFYREVKVGAELLKKIYRDIDELKLVCAGKMKPNSRHWYLNDCIKKQLIPKEWKMFEYLGTITLNSWVSDFSRRVKQLTHILSQLLKKNYCQDGISLGKLLFPEAFISATRQQVSHNTKKALETLRLVVTIGDSKVKNNNEFIVNELSLTCAKWKLGRLRLSDNLSNPLPSVKLKWVSEENLKKSGKVRVPLYKNKSREQLLCDFEVESNIPIGNVYWRGVSFLAWSES